MTVFIQSFLKCQSDKGAREGTTDIVTDTCSETASKATSTSKNFVNEANLHSLMKLSFNTSDITRPKKGTVDLRSVVRIILLRTREERTHFCPRGTTRKPPTSDTKDDIAARGELP